MAHDPAHDLFGKCGTLRVQACRHVFFDFVFILPGACAVVGQRRCEHCTFPATQNECRTRASKTESRVRHLDLAPQRHLLFTVFFL